MLLVAGMLFQDTSLSVFASQPRTQTEMTMEAFTEEAISVEETSEEETTEQASEEEATEETSEEEITGEEETTEGTEEETASQEDPSEEETTEEEGFPETVSGNQLETVSGNGLTVSGNDAPEDREERLRELLAQAKEALKELLASENVQALVYLQDTYQVSQEPSEDSPAAFTLGSGHTVLIQDVELETEKEAVWYRTKAAVNDTEYTGYINRQNLAYSNENFLQWEETYLQPILDLLSEAEGVPAETLFRNGTWADIEQFPESYRSALYSLKNSHNNWKFVKFNTGLDWDTVVYNELNPKERSLVPSSSKDSWKNGSYSSGWSYASENILKHFLDPRNSFSESSVFQFEQLTYNGSYHNAAAVQTFLNSTFMKGQIPGDSRTYAQAFYNIGSSLGVSPFHLAARVLQEQGSGGTSPMISGTYPGYEGYYNYFNVGASGSTNEAVYKSGLAYAKSQGWNTRYKSLQGGAATIGKNYILQGQDTIYLQKFDVDGSYNGLYWHQYMQNICAPTSEAASMRKLYAGTGSLGSSFVFKIPVYNNMPASAWPEDGLRDVITLSAKSIKLYAGRESYTFKNTKLNGEVISNNKLKWSSSNTKIATVTQNGVVTGHNPGKATITAKSDNGSATCEVTVIRLAESVTLNRKEMEVGKGLSKSLYAEVLPADTTDKSVTWKSDNEAVATVNASGRITGHEYGTAVITVTTADGTNLSDTCKITVVPRVKAVELAFTEAELLPEEKAELNGKVIPEEVGDKFKITYQSSDPAIASVDENGIITAVSVGNATITAAAGDRYTYCSVSVIPERPADAEIPDYVYKEPKDIAIYKITEGIDNPDTQLTEITGDTCELRAGGFLTLTHKVLPEDADVKSVSWKSSKPSVAYLEEQEDGTVTVTARTKGYTVVTVSTDIGIANSILLAVEEKEPVDQVTLQQTEAVLYANGTPDGPLPSELLLLPTPAASNEKAIAYEWSSTNPETASVDGNGKVTAHGPGAAVITAADAGGSGKYAICKVTVEIHAETLKTNVDSLQLLPGKKVTLTADTAPDNVTSSRLVYASSDETVAVVTEKGVVSAVKDAAPGRQAQITVTDEVSGLSKTIPVSIGQDAVSAVRLNQGGDPVKSAVLFANGGSDSKMTVSPNAYDKSGSRMEGISFYVKSSNPKAALAQPDGDGGFTITAQGKGTSKITFYAADGSGKSAAVNINVKLYPEAVTVKKQELYLTPGSSGTIGADVFPSNASDKSVKWKLREPVSGISISAAGKVAVAKGIRPETTAQAVAITNSGGVVTETPCTIKVVAKKVSSVKLNATSLLLEGLEETFQLKAVVAPDTATVKELKYTTSDEAVAAVDENGLISAKGYGNAVITAQTLDNSKKAVCRVSVSAIDKGYKISAVKSSYTIQSFGLDVNSSCTVQVKNQFGQILDNSLFEFTSSNEDAALVDGKGTVRPNPAYDSAKNGKTVITAAMPDDPFKRKVKFTVNILANLQAESIELREKTHMIKAGGLMTDFSPEKDNTLVFTAQPLNSYGNPADIPVKWSVSDSSAASVKVDKETGEAIVTVKKPARFTVTCTALDTWKRSASVKVAAIDTKPLLHEKTVTLNKQYETNPGGSAVRSDELHLTATNDCPIQSVAISSVKKGRTDWPASDFGVEKTGDGSYAVSVDQGKLSQIPNAKYTVTLEVKVKGLSGLGQPELVTHEMPVTLSVTDKKPKITVKAGSINRQNITRLSALLDIKGPAAVESVELVKGQANGFDSHFYVKAPETSGEGWQIGLKPEDPYSFKSMKGSLIVKLEGYQPAIVTVSVSTPLKKDSVQPSATPSLNSRITDASQITLYDKTTKTTLKKFAITGIEPSKLDITQDSRNPEVLNVSVKSGQKISNGATVSAKLSIVAMSDAGERLWKDAVAVTVKAKVYTTAPKPTMGTTVLQLSLQYPLEAAETSIKTDRDNQGITDDDEWLISKYNSRTGKYVKCDSSEKIAFKYNKQAGVLSVSMKDTSVAKGNYKYKLERIVEDFPNVSKAITVSVVDKAPGAKITAKGKLDLLLRKNSTMQAKIALQNIKGYVKTITLMEEQGGSVKHPDFYSVWGGENSFYIKVKEGSRITAGKKTVPVRLVLQGGTVIWSSVTFTVSQSTPKVSVPKAKTIYKSASDRTVYYDMNAQIPAGYAISRIDKSSVPDGIGVTAQDGYCSISLTNRSLKPGTYSVKVKLYFKGAQEVLGSSYGKAVEKTLKVIIRE